MLPVSVNTPSHLQSAEMLVCLHCLAELFHQHTQRDTQAHFLIWRWGSIEPASLFRTAMHTYTLNAATNSAVHPTWQCISMHALESCLTFLFSDWGHVGFAWLSNSNKNLHGLLFTSFLGSAVSWIGLQGEKRGESMQDGCRESAWLICLLLHWREKLQSGDVRATTEKKR